MRRGPAPFRFENMWFKAEGFKDLIRNWWRGIEVSGSASFRLSAKLKELKQKLKVWNREVFGNLECNKEAALQQVEYWDRVEGERSLIVEELACKKEAKEGYAKCVDLEETHWRQGIGTRDISTVWLLPIEESTTWTELKLMGLG